MMKHSLAQQRQMSQLYLFVLFVTTTFVVFFSSQTYSFTITPQVVVRSSVRNEPAASVVASSSRSVSTSTSSTLALYGKREKIKKKLKQMLGRRADEAVEDDTVLLSPDVDALSNFLVDGTYSGKKRNIIKKQLKKMVKSQSQSQQEEENKKAANTLDANTLHALSSLASLEKDIETLYVPISVVVDDALSQKIDEMDQKTKSGTPPRKKNNLNDMYRLIAEQKGNTVTYTDTETETETDTDTDTEIEKTETPKSSSSASSSSASFTSSTSPPEKKIVQNVLSKFTSKKSMDEVSNNDNSTSSPTTNKMVKLSTNEKKLEKLSQKYKEIDDVGERTYQMLLDLGMIGQ